MSIFVKSTLNEITVRNKEIQCKFFPLTGRYSIITPQGALTNIFPLIFIENESLTILDEPRPRLAPNWNIKKNHPNLTAFFPQKVKEDEFSEDMVQLQEFWDQIDQGLEGKIPLKFAASSAKGIITGNLCIKLYDSLSNAKYITIYLELENWEGFDHPPNIHSYVPLAADSLSVWELFDYRLNPRSITFFRNGYQSWTPNNLLDYRHKDYYFGSNNRKKQFRKSRLINL